jgi:alpha-tubulin suppressor-like RCC1 family protein
MAAVLVLAACSSDAPVMRQTFLCQTNSDCADGYRCDRPPGQDADICVAQDAVFSDASLDTSPPEDAQADTSLDTSEPQDAEADASPLEDTTDTPDADLQGEWTIAAGNYHVCAVSPAGNIYCWGDNSSGQLGIGSTVASRNTPQLVSLPTGTRFVASSDALAAGEGFSCALSRAGDVYCWGGNLLKQSAPDSDENAIPQPSRVDFPEPLYFIAVAAGQAHGCALSETGRLFCWGSESFGMRGHGSTVRGPAPTEVLLDESAQGAIFEQVVASERNTCASASNGALYCWGDDEFGQLGNGASISSSDRPESVSIESGLLTDNIGSLVATNETICVRTDDGDVLCWGGNASLQCGNGQTSAEGIEPLPVDLDIAVSLETLALGPYHGCASSVSDTYCWGSPNVGRLGGAAESDDLVASPTLIAGQSRAFRELALSADSSCGLTEDDTVWCWGSNSFGQLGVGSSPDQTASPERVTLPPE